MSAKDRSAGAEEMMKDFVATRPRRPKSGRVIAGVAAGIGRRYAIDPVVVRVALVVSAIYGGAGLIAYIVGWLLLAAEEDDVSPIEALGGKGTSSTSRGLTIVLCVLLIPAVGFTFGGHLSTIAGLIVLVGGLYLLHRYRADIGRIDPPRQAGSFARTADGEAATMTDSTGNDTAGRTEQLGPQDAVPPEYRDTPPAWDPLGAAPFAWDLPEPTPVPAPQPPAPAVRRRRSRIGLATMGILLVTAAALFAVGPHSGFLTVPHIIGILGAITGVGLIAGAFRHSGHGLIPVAILLSAAGVLSTAAHLDGWHGAGDAVYTPTTLTEVAPVYQRSVGSLRLDLTELPDSGSVTTSVTQGVGNLTVIVPDDATVHASCTTQVGNVTCLNDQVHGPNAPTLNRTKTGTGLTLFIDAHDGVGSVNVVTESQENGSAQPGPRGGH